ncbi:MAG: CDGSH iron-sulfur domain-containing protein [Coriobacteriales bacterium]|jgi:CDGSH-type Zn-finger protein|nr:CDGSH iron-sulfur domain-containing protein [Coriobacteriales bacterium]
MSDEPQIKIVKDGPYLVSGGVKLDHKVMVSVGHHREYHEGESLPQAQNYALCRCGHSKNMPFCDGSHTAAHFDGTEVASKVPFDERVEVFTGPTLDLYDDNRCAFARFCHREDGDVWTLTEESGNERLREEAIKAAIDCPAGRLVQHDKRADYAEIEPSFEPEIDVLEDPDKQCSGPLFVKGRLPLKSADGSAYEVRNRYALCRCGGSQNKPFCDAMHVNLGFNDGLKW